MADLTYKRLTRTIAVPAGGAELSFWMTRDTEFNWDFVFVEAHTVGQDDWTTLEDQNGHTSQETGFVCPFWLRTASVPRALPDTCRRRLRSERHHRRVVGGNRVQRRVRAVERRPVGLQWQHRVEVSISYASDDIVQGSGAFVDDIVVSTGEGTTSFEDDGNTFDGWTVPGAPAGSEPNLNDWIAGTVEDAPPSLGEVADGSLARQPEIIDFLEGYFGRYPFSAAGGVVDDLDELGFALETQTRPIYAEGFFGDSISGDSVVVHELAHQWVGDYLALEEWQHIWLNEGFASYAEWLWAEYEGLATAQEIFDFYASIPADDPFWEVVIGDPGPDLIFDIAIYNRGAMTLHALRLEVGDQDFFRILKRWIASQAGGHVTTDEFIALAERVSGQQLDELFDVWLFTPEKPAVLDAAAARVQSGATDLGSARPPLDKLAERTGLRR